MAEINSSITNVVLFVSIGVLIFIMIFFFAKRQISRFALKSSKSPHEVIGHHAPTALLLEIERRLRRVKDISIEPRLILPNRQDELKRRAKIDASFHYYRMQTLDSVFHLYEEIKKCNPGAVKKVGVPLRVFLFEQRQVGCLEGIKLEVIEKFCSSYDHARHDPNIFTKSHFKEFQGILKLLLHFIHNKNKMLQQQLYSAPPSPTEHSDRSAGSLQKLIPLTTPLRNPDQPTTPTTPFNKPAWPTTWPNKASAQSVTRAFTENNDFRTKITNKMYATTNMMGRAVPSEPSSPPTPPNLSNKSFINKSTTTPTNADHAVRPTAIKLLPSFKNTLNTIKKKITKHPSNTSPDLNLKSMQRVEDERLIDDNLDGRKELNDLNIFDDNEKVEEIDKDVSNIITNNKNNTNNNSFNSFNNTNSCNNNSNGSFNNINSFNNIYFNKSSHNPANLGDGEDACCSVSYNRLADLEVVCVGSVNEAIDDDTDDDMEDCYGGGRDSKEKKSN